VLLCEIAKRRVLRWLLRGRSLPILPSERGESGAVRRWRAAGGPARGEAAQFRGSQLTGLRSPPGLALADARSRPSWSGRVRRPVGSNDGVRVEARGASQGMEECGGCVDRSGKRAGLLADLVGSDLRIYDILDELVERIVGVLPVSGAGVMLMGARDELHSAAASNGAILAIETFFPTPSGQRLTGSSRAGQPSPSLSI
jgi:hypothetical protein